MIASRLLLVGALVSTLAPSVFAAGSSLGEYTSVECSTLTAFSENSCNQCFDGGTVKSGQILTGLFDTWSNNNATPQVMYKDEQTMPTMVNLGGANTEWTSKPTDNEKVWQYTTEVVWSSAGSGSTKQSFLIMPGDKVKFIEADLGAGYNLVKTDKKVGDALGMVKFPINYRNVSDTGTEGEKQTHYECVVYKAAAVTPAAVTPTPEPTETTPTVDAPAPAPEQMTQPKTGVESLFLIAAAFFIAFGLMFSLRRKS